MLGKWYHADQHRRISLLAKNHHVKPNGATVALKFGV